MKVSGSPSQHPFQGGFGREMSGRLCSLTDGRGNWVGISRGTDPWAAGLGTAQGGPGGSKGLSPRRCRRDPWTCLPGVPAAPVPVSAAGEGAGAEGGRREAGVAALPVPHRALPAAGGDAFAPAESPAPMHCAEVSTETTPLRALGSARGRAWLSVDPTARSGCCLLKTPPCIPPCPRLPGPSQPGGTRRFPRRWRHPSRGGCAFTGPPHSRPCVFVCVCVFEGESELLQASRWFPKHRPAAAFFQSLLLKQHLGSVRNCTVKRDG